MFMLENIVRLILPALFIVVWALVIVRIIIKTFKNKYASVTTVQAVVIDKHKIETFPHYSEIGKGEKYAVVFSVDGKKKSFYVSQFSYDGYEINEKGTLKYKGDQLIGFN